jgi:hypothetical protein
MVASTYTRRYEPGIKKYPFFSKISKQNPKNKKSIPSFKKKYVFFMHTTGF